jgi:ComF family protein
MVKSIENLIPRDETWDLVTCVPMHVNKIKQRGFNQASLIGKRLSKALGIHFTHDLIIKRNDNVSQSGLDKNQRKVNVKGIFCVNQIYSTHISGKTIIIVDDVITTGATVDECARILKQKGAKKIIAVSFARTY